MGRRARSEIARQIQGQSWDGAAGLLAAALIAAVLALVISASSALAATGPPELIAPTASSVHSSPLSIEYKLPEAGSAGTITLIPSEGAPVVVTLSSPALAAGKHHFFLDLGSLESETANVAKSSAASLPDGEYTVLIGYQNVAKDPTAIASAEKVTIKTQTSTPTMTEPTAGQSFRKPFKVKYTLPEAALPGSAKLLLIRTHAGTKTLVLANAEAGTHTAEVLPSDPALGAGVASAPSERLPTDSYQLALTYQDALGNPFASVSVPIEIGYPKCLPGSYSASGGEEPCTQAPKGYFVAGEGAMTAAECPAGHFAAEEGLSICVPAAPGHYVPATGAKAELECEQGTYSGETGRSSCLPAPLGHYAPKGAFAPTACPAGKFDAHTNSPSAEFCEYDSPGSYSGEGADEPIPCVPGKYAFAYGSEICLPAPVGSYVPAIGASIAIPCPAGTFAPVTESTSCITTPADTYATGDAGEATPCPAGTHSPAGASSCAAVSKETSASDSSPTSTSTSTTSTATTSTGAKPSTSTPPPISIAPLAGTAAKLAIAAAKHGTSLAKTSRQHYLVTCSAAMTVQLRVVATLRAGQSHLALSARTLTLKCKAGKANEVSASFRLSGAAQKLLATHGASVKLAVRAYAPASAGGKALASATLPGRP
jgi:hypothetical protein